jgi:anti-sigma B factor antagonist/stage II sporulation protein AA (anti-sigma F factor antagonist)
LVEPSRTGATGEDGIVAISDSAIEFASSSGLFKEVVLERHLKWPLELKAERSGDVQVLILTGRLGNHSARLLGDAIAEALVRTPRIVVDFAGVDYISSAGLHVIRDAADRCARIGGALVLSTVAEPVRIALDLSLLLPRLCVEPSRDRAILRARTEP